jgi:hypothetical protein
VEAAVSLGAVSSWESITQPMNNCLRPANIPCSGYQISPACAQEVVDIPDCDRDAMPPNAGSFIPTQRV